MASSFDISNLKKKKKKLDSFSKLMKKCRQGDRTSLSVFLCFLVFLPPPPKSHTASFFHKLYPAL